MKRHQRRNRWVVSKRLKLLLNISIGLSVFVLANTAYLLLNRAADGLGIDFFSAGNTSIPALFQAMVLSHTAAGSLLVVLMLLFGFLHLPRVWRMYRKESGLSGTGFMVIGAVLGITGLFILTSAASRENDWAWWTHVVCGILAPVGYFLHRLSSRGNKPEKTTLAWFGKLAGSLLLVALVGHGFTNKEVILTEEALKAREQGLHEGPGARDRDVSKFLDDSFVPSGFIPPESPFFPSGVTTSTGGHLPSRIITRGELGDETIFQDDLQKYGFVQNTSIGAETCERCHQDIVKQWEGSAHRFASFNNPFYEATITDLRKGTSGNNVWVEKHMREFSGFDKEAVGMVKSKFCSGCHDPALMLAGDMDRPIDRNRPEAQAGLTCLACHAIDKIHGKVGNANYNLADEQEDPYIFPNAKEGSLGAFLHDAAIKAKPNVHKQQFMGPVFSTSEYCLTCHKVSIPESINNYRWLRGQDEYDNWHDSGISQNASRTFYLPPAKRVCQDCHMPPEPAPLGDLAAVNGTVRSHRFLAVNTALPFIRGDTATLRRTEEFMQNEKLGVDIMAITLEGAADPIMAPKKDGLQLLAGKRVTVDVVVRNKGVGHTFPGGTNDSNEGWLEFSLKDKEGNTLMISGQIGDYGHLDSMAHVYKVVFVNENSNIIHRRDAQNIRVNVFTNVIGPGTADIAHYSFEIPEAFVGKQLAMQARLLWRKFDRRYLEFAFKANPEGFKRFNDIPDLPVTEIAADHLDFTVVDKETLFAHGPANPEPFSNADWMRFNDYGIGLLLENDTRGATRAFQVVGRLQPDRLDGPLNLAKTALNEGDLKTAYQYLQTCEEIKKGDPQAAWVWGRVRQEDGMYEDAIAAYNYVLKTFPEDRAAWRQLGRTYYLDQQYEKSMESYNQVLAIDPEDREAYYHLSLNYRALGKNEEADIMEKAFRYYQIDESAAETARKFRLKDPGANLMAQDIRIHMLEFDLGARSNSHKQ